jgi:hypothetical protein
MTNLPIYEVPAKAFADEGVDTLFNLMGDGNMARAAIRILAQDSSMRFARSRPSR